MSVFSNELRIPVVNADQFRLLIESSIGKGMDLGSPWSICELDISDGEVELIRRKVYGLDKATFVDELIKPDSRDQAVFGLLVAWCDSCARNARPSEVWQCLAADFADPELSDFLLNDSRRYRIVAEEIIRFAKRTGLRYVDSTEIDAQWMYRTLRLNHAISRKMLPQLQRELASKISGPLLDKDDWLYSASFSALRQGVTEQNTSEVEHSPWIAPDAAEELISKWESKERSNLVVNGLGKVGPNHRLTAVWSAGRPWFSLQLDPAWKALSIPPGRADVMLGGRNLGTGIVQVAQDGTVLSFDKVHEIFAEELEESVSLWRNGGQLPGTYSPLLSDDIAVFDGLTGRLRGAALQRRSRRSYIIGAAEGAASSSDDIEQINLGGRTWFLLPSGWAPAFCLRLDGLPIFSGDATRLPVVRAEIVGEMPKRSGDRFRLRVETETPSRVAVVRVAEDSAFLNGFADPPTNKVRKLVLGRLTKPSVSFLIEINSKGTKSICRRTIRLPNFLDIGHSESLEKLKLPPSGEIEFRPVVSVPSRAELLLNGDRVGDMQLFYGGRTVRWHLPAGSTGRLELRILDDTFQIAEQVLATGWLENVECRGGQLSLDVSNGLTPDSTVVWTSKRCKVYRQCVRRLQLDSDEDVLAVAILSCDELVGLWLAPNGAFADDVLKPQRVGILRWFGVVPPKPVRGWDAALQASQADYLPGTGRSAFFDRVNGDLLEGVSLPGVGESERLLQWDWARAISFDARIGIGVVGAISRFDTFTAAEEFAKLQAVLVDEGAKLPDPTPTALTMFDKLPSGEAQRKLLSYVNYNIQRLRDEEADSFDWFRRRALDGNDVRLSEYLEAIAHSASCPSRRCPLVFLCSRLVGRFERVSNTGHSALLARLQGKRYDRGAVLAAISEQDHYEKLLQARICKSSEASNPLTVRHVTELLKSPALETRLSLQASLDQSWNQGSRTLLVEAILAALAVQIPSRSGTTE